MRIFIPTNRIILGSVIDSIKRQNIDTEIIEKRNYSDKNEPKYSRIADVKTKILEEAIKFGEIFVMNDDDVEHLYNDNLFLMKQELIRNQRLGAIVPLRNDGRYNTGHICNGIIMIHPRAFGKIRFDLFKEVSTCLSISTSLQRSGLDYKQLDNKIRAKHNLQKD